MKSVLCLLTMLLITSQSFAESWFDKKINGKYLYDLFAEAAVPKTAIDRTFEFLDLNENKEFKVKISDNDYKTAKISNKKYGVIIDFSKPSSERRLFLLNFETGAVEKYFVAHGVNTGQDLATSFSNKTDSKKTSLGFYLTGSTYVGSHGESLTLHGLEKSNDNAFERAIVMHGASYVSMDFLDKYGRMGRSWGCPAVSDAIIKKLNPLLKDGAILYAYHKDLMPMTQTSPAIQNMGSDQKGTSENSDQVMPEEQNP
ncbi:MAG: murein L,D-transpeptidase catalytic domain family protein [Pseudobdellovibrionaceae bacterium]